MTNWAIKGPHHRPSRVGACVGLALAWGAVAAGPARADDTPTSLLPQPAAPVTSAPLSVAPSGGAPASPTDTVVQVQQLQGIDPNAFGTLDEAHGGFPPTIWSGSDPAVIAKLLAAQGPSASRPMQSLDRRLLLSVAMPPMPSDGVAKAGEIPLLEFRARALWAIGDGADLATLLKALPLPAVTPRLRRLRADAALLVGDSGTACAEAAPLATASAIDSYPVELRIYCQFAAGQASSASLGIDVLREQGVKDPDFFALADALSGLGSPPKDGLTNPSPLTLAMARLAKAEQPTLAPDASPMTERSVALVTGAPLDVRIDAGERAEAVGALDTDTLRRLYESVPFTADELANAEAKATADKSPRTRALLFQAAEHQTAPLAKAGLAARELIQADGNLFFVEARLLAPVIAGMQPSSDTAIYAPVLARAMLAAHQPDAARAWIGLARAQATADKSAADGAAGLAVVARLARLDEGKLSDKALAAWQKAAPDSAPDRADRRTALALGLLAALGDPPPQDASLAGLDGPTLIAAQVPRPALAMGLDAAVAGKREGEIVLYLYAELSGDGLTQIDIADLVRAVTILKAAGFEDDARSLALEAALASGV